MGFDLGIAARFFGIFFLLFAGYGIGFYMGYKRCLKTRVLNEDKEESKDVKKTEV